MDEEGEDNQWHGRRHLFPRDHLDGLYMLQEVIAGLQCGNRNSMKPAGSARLPPASSF
jgi:hypothetical protein